ncbi:hypothetical protein PILCRDRAFT_69108 [Piloderma croceum F 1598]|uniref:Peptidase A1 domain-containing protein n=1 Tax=Piloderma croceum (strain F 1598) TaxID=765440 RepID=A0A0C3FH16_PILCF|nr:hypothetical protein PILCRDRAFT_69108 [Piloderma croceum F 1598]
MYGFAQIALALATFLSTTAASPLRKSGNFSVVQKLNTQFVRSGPAAYARAFKKFNKPMPHDLAVATGNDGSVTASPEDAYDSEYLCPVSIDGQTLALDFDTGSADLWVFSTSLPSSEQKGHTLFDPSKSTNWKALSGYKWNITYGDGSGASGTVGTDVVTVGGTSVSGQAVEIATKVSSAFVSDTANDGLLGLAFSSINTVTPKAQHTFFDTAKSSLSSPVFTADLKHRQLPGTYDFGTIDSSKYTGTITYIDVDTANGFWEFTGSGYAVGSGSFVSSSIDAIADTGTTLIYVPDAVVTAYYKQVSGASYDSSQGGYTFPCSATLPNLTLGIGSYHAVVPGQYINYSPASGSKCFGGVQSDSGIGFSIYGDVFLKSQFVIFDGSSTPRLGFAAKST